MYGIRTKNLTSTKSGRESDKNNIQAREAYNKLNGYLGTIIDCTDKLLTHHWRNNNNESTEAHFNIIEQSQQLLLAIFGYVASQAPPPLF